MRRVRVTLPASITNLGPGYALGLALGIHTIVDISERTDDQLVVEPTGEGAGDYSVGLRHPVVNGLIRIFQRLEKSLLGLTIRIDNRIPIGSGLGAEAAFVTAGMIAANNLMGTPFDRETMFQLVSDANRKPSQAITSILGGLTASLGHGETLVYRSLPVAPLRVIVTLPELDSYANDIEKVIPERVMLDDALQNVSRLPMLLDGLREGDLALLARVMDDRLHTRFYTPFIKGFDAVRELVKSAGDGAVTLSAEGPALVIFSEAANQRKLADAVQAVFQNNGVKTRTWMLPVDRQGIVVSAAQSS